MQTWTAESTSSHIEKLMSKCLFPPFFSAHPLQSSVPEKLEGIWCSDSSLANTRPDSLTEYLPFEQFIFNPWKYILSNSSSSSNEREDNIGTLMFRRGGFSLKSRLKLLLKWILSQVKMIGRVNVEYYLNQMADMMILDFHSNQKIYIFRYMDDDIGFPSQALQMS